MLLETPGDAFPYLLMHLVLKICQGLSAADGRERAKCLFSCPCVPGGSTPLFHTEGLTWSQKSILSVLPSTFLFPALHPGQHLTIEQLTKDESDISTTAWSTFILLPQHLCHAERRGIILWLSRLWPFCMGKKEMMSAKAIQVAGNEWGWPCLSP